MPDPRRQLGNWGEERVAEFLRRQGYVIIERNWRCAAGELDIIAWEGEWLAFIEVRTRRGRSYGTPEESITPAKQAKLIELARLYMQEHPKLECDWRIDVVAVELQRGSLPRVNLIRSAVMG
ncbi:MAG: YraN family protein [Chloroflexota bacterium]|nr:YraN family protein [Chloroflexota bacterium]